MWIYTPTSAVSVVMHRDDPEQVIVRSRDIDDLVLFISPEFTQGIRRTPDADYEYRVFMSRDAFARLVEDFIRTQLDYTNVKGETHTLAENGVVSKEKVQQMHRVYNATLPLPQWPREWGSVFDTPYRETVDADSLFDAPPPAGPSAVPPPEPRRKKHRRNRNRR